MGIIKFGADPELFSIENGYAVPPIEYMSRGVLEVYGYHKDNPMHPIVFRRSDFFVHQDGVLFEFIVRPQESLRALRDFIVMSMSRFADVTGIKLTAIPAAELDTKRYPQDRYRDLYMFGCLPDRDPSIEFNPTWGDIEPEDSWRYAGGHISISIEDGIIKDEKDADELALLLGLTVSLPYRIFSKDYMEEYEARRAKMYGTPAKYRGNKLNKGIFEFRTPSNQWLLFEPEHLDIMEDGFRAAVNMLKSGFDLFRKYYPYLRDIYYSDKSSIALFWARNILPYAEKYK